MLKEAYNAILRPHLPRKIASKNGVAVRQPRLFDATDVVEDYDPEYIAALNDAIRPGDHVVIVGGGEGVSTVRSARATGPDGRVDSYEPGDVQFSRVCETVELNRPRASVNVHRAAVGETVKVWGDPSQAEVIDASELPECDVLGIDAEGAEATILRGEFGNPRELVVEYHDEFGSSMEDVEEALDVAGYRTVDHRPDQPERGIGVLRAARD